MAYLGAAMHATAAPAFDLAVNFLNNNKIGLSVKVSCIEYHYQPQLLIFY